MLARISATIALLLSTLGVVACGGDDSGGGVSKEDFAKRANEVCNDVERELNSLSSGNAQNAEDVAKLIDNVIAKSREAVDRLKALEDLKDAVKKGDQEAAAKAAQEIQKLSDTKSNELAREAGATDCASG